MAEAIAINVTLEHLDLFNVEFSNFGCRFLERAIRRNSTTLKTLRLANTKVTVDHAELLIEACNNSAALTSLRWVNLLPMRDGNYWDRNDKEKVIQVEHSAQPITVDTFLNPRMGDLLYEFLQDVYKCQYWSK